MKRPGYTLVELVMVMSLLVVGASLAFPVVDSLLRPGKIGAAGDQVRSICADLRGKAMNEGRNYRFSVEDGSNKYRLEPDDVADEKGYEYEGELPEGIQFASDPDSLKGGSSVSGGGWRPVAVFQPDGTTRDDAAVVFGLPREPATVLRIRALTGAISKDDSAKPSGTP